MEGLRLPELVIILVIFAVLFGGAKLPQLGEGLGKAIRNFKDAMNGKDEAQRSPPPPPPDQPAPPEALPPASKR
jgi:sec-independent protein translocase protein TatA